MNSHQKLDVYYIMSVVADSLATLPFMVIFCLMVMDMWRFSFSGIKFTNAQTEEDAKEFFIMAANPEINQEMCSIMTRLWEDPVSANCR